MANVSGGTFIKVKTTALGVFNIKQREANAGLRAVWQRVGETWHKKHRPMHFTRSAYSRYNYDRRNKRYTKAKRAKWGHVKPLTYSGKSKAATDKATIVSTPKGVKIKMGAGNLTQRNPKSNINMEAELLKVNAQEQREYATLMQTALDRMINLRNAQLRRK